MIHDEREDSCLTFGPSALHNKSMRFLRRILVVACSLMVLMPMGWCCWLVPVAQAETASVPVCHSCCSQQKATPAPAKQKDTPQPAPCECKPLPADLALPKD